MGGQGIKKGFLINAWFLISLICIGFAYGVAVGKYRVPPFALLNAAHDWYLNWRSHSGLEPPQIANRSIDEESILTISDDRAFRGLTLIPGYFDDGDIGHNGAKLFSIDGEILHEWNLKFSSLYDDDSHVQEFYGHGVRDWDFASEQAHLFPNGDLVALSPIGLFAKLDWCGNVLWRVNRAVHHGFNLDDEGNIWALAWKVRVDVPPRFTRLYGTLREDMLIKI